VKFDRLLHNFRAQMSIFGQIRMKTAEFTPDLGITAELRRQGMAVNHKRVSRIMCEDSLVGSTKREQWFADSTDPQDQEIYVNLANRLNLTGPNQVWVADITFIRLRHEFVYLAAVLDKFSRKVVGWNLARTLTARLPLAALERWLLRREGREAAWFTTQIVAPSMRTLATCAYCEIMERYLVLAGRGVPAIMDTANGSFGH
jgi:transposase InsO family protein